MKKTPGKLEPVARFTLATGERGTDQTIAAMTATAHDAAENSQNVLELAARIREQEETDWLRIKALYNFLAERVEFFPDRPGVEEIRHPEAMLRAIERSGTVAADCDDRATLGVAVLRAMRLPAFFVVMAREPLRGFHHVYYAAAVTELPTVLIPCDPQAGTPCGAWTPDARRKIYYA